jgi:hypothetical protein
VFGSFSGDLELIRMDRISRAAIATNGEVTVDGRLEMMPEKYTIRGSETSMGDMGAYEGNAGV